MGRPRKEVSETNRSLGRLQQWLREQMAAAGLGYRELAERAGCHPTSMQRVVSGQAVPTEAKVTAFARACGADSRVAWRLRCAAVAEQCRLVWESVSPNLKIRPAPKPVLIRDVADLSVALEALWRGAGEPSLRLMQRRAGGYDVLPTTSAYRIRRRLAVPRNLGQLFGYLRACGVEDPGEMQVWEQSWRRAWASAGWSPREPDRPARDPGPKPLMDAHRSLLSPGREGVDHRSWLGACPAGLGSLAAVRRVEGTDSRLGGRSRGCTREKLIAGCSGVLARRFTGGQG